MKRYPRGASLIVSVGPWGGFYCGHSRLCLGFVALTLYWFDIDDFLGDAAKQLLAKKEG